MTTLTATDIASTDHLRQLPEMAVDVRDLTKTFGRGDAAVHALRSVSATIERRSFVAVMGPSGSGKSTFLQCAAGLERPTSGEVILGGTDISRLGEVARTKLRRRQIGFVFQAYNLLPALTVAQNIGLPFRLAGSRPDAQQVREVMQRTGLVDRARHRPAQLSGGQQQRVAIARALVTRPQVVFADEPTGALDARTSRVVLGLLRECVDRDGLTVVMVTHDAQAASYADAVIFLADGRIVDRVERPTPEAVAARMLQLGAE